MPPETPSSSRATGYRLPVLVLDLAGGDLFEGDRQVVLRPRLHHRGRELVEGALAEVVVVRVDLPGALGGDDDARVVGVDLVQQLVNSWLDHGVESSGRDSAPRTIDSSSSTAFSSRSLTTTCGNSGSASSSSRAVCRRRSTSSAVFVPRPTRRARSASSEGGAMKTWHASGMRSRIWRAPWTSISSTTGTPALARRSSSERSVP